jgi:anti-sigma factor RsiW
MINPITRTRFRLDHRWTPRRLSDFVDGDLPPRGRSRLQRHVDKCPDCYRALVTLQRMLDRLHRLPPPAAGRTPDIAAAVRHRLDDPTED